MLIMMTIVQPRNLDNTIKSGITRATQINETDE